jgi:hypothetical protein
VTKRKKQTATTSSAKPCGGSLHAKPVPAPDPKRVHLVGMVVDHPFPFARILLIVIKFFNLFWFTTSVL